MGLDMYLEKRKLVSTNGGSSYDMENPRVDTVEITIVGCWRKKYELDEFIADLVGDNDYSNCQYWYISFEQANQIVEKAKERIIQIPQEIELLKHQMQDKRLNEESKMHLSYKVNDKERELTGWESAKKIFTQVLEDYKKEAKIDYYYSRWY